MMEDRSMGSIYCNLSDLEAIEDFMIKAGYFNDSLLKEVQYKSGSNRDHLTNSIKIVDDLAQLKLIFESQLNKGKVIEIVFEHIVRFNLVPIPVEYDSLFENPYIFIEDGYIYFSRYESEVNNLDISSLENTWIKAKNAKYRIIT